MEFVDLTTQYQRYKPDIEARLQAVFQHGRYIMGPEIAELESQLAQYAGVKHCITVSSGTMSLEIALRALGIGPGDEVITVPFTWISTAEVIMLVGAKPVFVDIDERTFNMNPEALADAITPRTAAIIPVNLFGQMADYQRINAVARKHGLAVIEDAAQSFGASQSGQRSCGIATVGSTSFFPAKPFGCYGDGGALFTSDDALAEKMSAIRTHGGVRRHEHSLVGTNGRFDTLQAAVLLAKLPYLESELAARNRAGDYYNSRFRDVCIIPETIEGNTHVYGQYTIRIPHRDGVAAKLKSAGVPTAVYYPKCLHEQPVFAPLGYGWGRFPISEKASREVLSLPMHPFLTETDQEKVIAVLSNAVTTRMPATVSARLAAVE